MIKIVAITGGVGGAKLALGLTQLLTPAELVFVVNTGDDFEHLGVHISPDLDTLMYTLSGLSNPETGWGRRGESWNFIETLRGLGGESWFNLGDRDLAVHVQRTDMLRKDIGLSAATAALYAAMGIKHRALPMSDDPVRTMINSGERRLAFQHYFVRERCEPVVDSIEFAGAENARPLPEMMARLNDDALMGVIICPSNPFLSVDPILALTGVREALTACRAPVVAVSPVIGGEAVKGPTTKIMQELELARDAAAVAAHYGDLLDGFIIDRADAGLEQRIQAGGVAVEVAQTLMQTLDDRVDLAHTALAFIARLRGNSELASCE